MERHRASRPKRVLRAVRLRTPARVITTVGSGAGVLPHLPRRTTTKRQDLIMSPAAPCSAARRCKGQELEEHYFGAIRPSVQRVHEGARRRAVGSSACPAKTKHNEVAPAQHELAPVFTNSNRAIDENLLTMEKMRLLASPSRPGVPAAREALRGHQRLGQAQQLVHLGRQDTTCSTRARRPWTTCASCVFLTGVIQAVDDYQELLRMSVAIGRQRPPPGRERGPAGHHLHLPGRRAREPSWTRSSTATPTRSADKVAMDLGVARAAELPEGQHRPQPHLTVRVHGQQVRVPHAGLRREPVRLRT